MSPDFATKQVRIIAGCLNPAPGFTTICAPVPSLDAATGRNDVNKNSGAVGISSATVCIDSASIPPSPQRKSGKLRRAF
ncbi:hypothetical protein NIES4075_67380 [Tolypothrix sp. NIES-4075]|nr:hypothetical protein NIES4075_67380 [Tolypothrix sp. NIES-4075]